jgi:calcium-dependent protein kinase
VEGGELFDEIQKKGVFSEAIAASVMSQLLSAIAYCHERKIVHRDLKPENILIDSAKGANLSIKVIDFGTAQAFTAGTKLRATLGTPYYIAPEVLFKSYNEKCDVWSAGVILYILLSGSPPFDGTTDDDIMKAVKKTKFSFSAKVWDEISPEAKDLISKMIKYPPESRLSAQEAFNHPWIKSKKFNELKPETAKYLMANLKNFHVKFI